VKPALTAVLGTFSGKAAAAAALAVVANLMIKVGR